MNMLAQVQPFRQQPASAHVPPFHPLAGQTHGRATKAVLPDKPTFDVTTMSFDDKTAEYLKHLLEDKKRMQQQLEGLNEGRASSATKAAGRSIKTAMIRKPYVRGDKKDTPAHR